MSKDNDDQLNNCQSDFDPDSISLEQARERILDSLRSASIASHTVALTDALGLTLTEDILAPQDVPPFRNSAMDGFACRLSDLPDSGQVSLPIVGESLAGHPYTKNLEPNTAILVTTGALLPDNADAVIMQEQVSHERDHVCFDSNNARNPSFIRQRGSDTRAGSVVIHKGQTIRPVHIGILASLGIAELPVAQKLKVALLSTGDELVNVGNALGEGKIYDSNRPALAALLTASHIEIIDVGIIKDDPDSIRTALEQAASSADVIISSGGVSVGKADYLRSVLNSIGQLNFWKIAMKPGRPLTYGQIENTPYFGLPGNPVSSLITFRQLVLPALDCLQGKTKTEEISMFARTQSALKKQPGRLEFQRGVLSHREDGTLCVHTTGAQDSHVLRSLCDANCLIELPAESSGAETGDFVKVCLL